MFSRTHMPLWSLLLQETGRFIAAPCFTIYRYSMDGTGRARLESKVTRERERWSSGCGGGAHCLPEKGSETRRRKAQERSEHLQRDRILLDQMSHSAADSARAQWSRLDADWPSSCHPLCKPTADRLAAWNAAGSCLKDITSTPSALLQLCTSLCFSEASLSTQMSQNMQLLINFVLKSHRVVTSKKLLNGLMRPSTCDSRTMTEGC